MARRLTALALALPLLIPGQGQASHDATYEVTDVVLADAVALIIVTMSPTTYMNVKLSCSKNFPRAVQAVIAYEWPEGHLARTFSDGTPGFILADPVRRVPEESTVDFGQQISGRSAITIPGVAPGGWTPGFGIGFGAPPDTIVYLAEAFYGDAPETCTAKAKDSLDGEERTVPVQILSPGHAGIVNLEGVGDQRIVRAEGSESKIINAYFERERMEEGMFIFRASAGFGEAIVDFPSGREHPPVVCRRCDFGEWHAGAGEFRVRMPLGAVNAFNEEAPHFLWFDLPDEITVS